MTTLIVRRPPPGETCADCSTPATIRTTTGDVARCGTCAPIRRDAPADRATSRRIVAEMSRERWALMSPSNRIHARKAYRWQRRAGMDRQSAHAASMFLILAGGDAERNRRSTSTVPTIATD